VIVPSGRHSAPRPFEVPSGRQLRVWLLMGDRAGDNVQILALGEALGWPLETKRLVYTSYERLVNLPFLATLAGIVPEESSPLEPPWPDLVISAGRRNEPVARWIQKQAPGRVRLVHVGRPWAPIECFDLVVTTPQYRLPHLPNVLHNDGPLHRVTRERLAEEAKRWAPRLAHLPRPYVAVLAGGNSGPYPFDRASGARLARMVDEFAEARSASVLVTTSARTQADTVEALFAGIRRPSFLFRWAPDATDNPYFAFLGLADAVVVTGDSVSMMAEACATGRPVYLYDTGEGKTSMRTGPNADHAADAAPHARWRGLQRSHLKAFVYRHAMSLGPTRWTRDIRIVHRLLVESGRAAWLGQGDPDPEAQPLRDVERAVERVRALFEPRVIPEARPSPVEVTARAPARSPRPASRLGPPAPGRVAD
jgi:mitochondrial fission protein ELM1